MTKLFDPFCQIRKNIVHMKLQPRMKALVTLGWRLKYLFFILHVTRDQCQSSCAQVGQELSFSDAAIRPWEMHVLHKVTLMELLNTLLFIVCG